MSPAVDHILDDILKREDWPTVSNRASDRGALTKGGVTFTTYNAWLKQKGKPPLTPSEFPMMSEQDAREFMIDSIAGPLLDLADEGTGRLFAYLFDWAETTGPQTPTRALQQSLRELGVSTLLVDGIYGTQTKQAAHSLLASGLEDELIQKLVESRIDFYIRIAVGEPVVLAFRQANPSNLDNVRGWVLRAFDAARHHDQ